jgi:hypothetical protein
MKTVIERWSALFGWCREKGPHPRSIDAANVNEAIYTRNADHLMLFWRFVRVTSSAVLEPIALLSLKS